MINDHLDVCLTRTPKRQRRAHASTVEEGASTCATAVAASSETAVAASSDDGNAGRGNLHLLKKLLVEVNWDNPEATGLLAKQVQEWKDLQCGFSPSTDCVTASFAALEAQLALKQQCAMVDLSHTLATAAAQVAHWHNAAKEHAEGAAGSLEAYGELGCPTTYEEQCERNRKRAELQAVVRGVGEALDNMHAASGKPGLQLEETQGAMLKQMSTAIERMRGLLEEAQGLFKEKRMEVQRDRDRTSAMLSDMWPHVDRMNSFVRRCAQEETNEASEARGVHKERLEQLRQEEARYVRANDSPERNQTFARVRDDIKTATELLEENRKKDVEREARIAWWEGLLSKMPGRAAPEQPPPSRKRKWFW